MYILMIAGINTTLMRCLNLENPVYFANVEFPPTVDVLSIWLE